MPADFCFRTAHSPWRDSIHIGQTILCLDPLLLNDNVMVGLRVERIWNGRGNIEMMILGNGVVGMAWCLTWRTGAGREGGRAEAEVGVENEGEETGTAIVIEGATTASGGRFSDEVLKRLSCLFRVPGVDCECHRQNISDDQNVLCAQSYSRLTNHHHVPSSSRASLRPFLTTT